MVRRERATIYILKDPNAKYKGWAWVDISLAVAERFNLLNEWPLIISFTPEEHEELQSKGINCPSFIMPTRRTRAAGKKFIVNNNGEFINLSVQKSVLIEAICLWVKTWAEPNAKLITPGKRTISLAGESIARGSAFVYFVHNADSNAMKIGRAKNLEKRLSSLQTSSPATLKLVKAIQVTSGKEAAELEYKLHQQFTHLRITGEWFKTETELLDYLKSPLNDTQIII